MGTKIKLGNGNFDIALSGAGNDVTLGNGNSEVFGGTDSNVIVIGNGDSTVSLSGSSNSVTVGSGNNTVTLGGSKNTVSAANGNDKITVKGGGDTITAGNGNNTITLGGIGSSVKLGDGNDTVHGGTGDTIHIAATTLSIYGNNELVFLSPSAATVNDLSTGLTLKIGPAASIDTLANFAADPTGVVDLVGGIGGFTTPTQVLSALTSDGHGGTLLSFGPASSLDFIGVSASQLHAANFKIG